MGVEQNPRSRFLESRTSFETGQQHRNLLYDIGLEINLQSADVLEYLSMKI